MSRMAWAGWVDRWNQYWFSPSSALNLAGARIVAVAAQLFWFFPPLGLSINLAHKNSGFTDPQPIIRALDAMLPREMLFSADGLTAIHGVTFAAGLAALVGLWTRPSLALFALGNWFFVSHNIDPPCLLDTAYMYPSRRKVSNPPPSALSCARPERSAMLANLPVCSSRMMSSTFAASDSTALVQG